MSDWVIQCDGTFVSKGALYTDTDSISYTTTRVESGIQTSWRILGGGFETPHKGLTQYVGLGAKNYAIRFTDDTSECKVRGFTLNYQTSKMIDFDTMLEMLQKKPSHSVICGCFSYGRVFSSYLFLHGPQCTHLRQNASRG